MYINLFLRARIRRGHHMRLAVDGESDVADEPFVQDGVNLRFIVNAALRAPPDLRSFGGG